MSDAAALQAAWLKLFLCGDVMTGRAIDQVLPHPGAPDLHEPCLRSALEYVALAEGAHGPIPRPADFDYVWGEALAILDAVKPDARIVNLETAVTRAQTPWPGKQIHYRMHPDNVPCLTAAHIDCCVLANNHVLDWGHAGLEETLHSLHRAGIRTAGAGRDEQEAASPAVLDLPGGRRVLVFAFGCESAGIDPEWAASGHRPGVNFLRAPTLDSAREIARRIGCSRRAGDVAVVSVHWGPNWGYQVPRAHREFSHALIDSGHVQVVHGHSSHHPLAAEAYRNGLILYGCGDFLNDYEGISGYEYFRGDLTFMYFACLDATGRASARLELTPMQIQRFRLRRASAADADWLAQRLVHEEHGFGMRVARRDDAGFELTRREP
jgi:poly-gamma-glutamate synthesis protein (capsule biosynthesis protein)